MPKYTTIRISIEDKKRLRKIARLMRAKSLSEALRRSLILAEKELDKVKEDTETVLTALKYAKDIGETNAEQADKYLYGEEN